MFLECSLQVLIQRCEAVLRAFAADDATGSDGTTSNAYDANAGRALPRSRFEEIM